MHPPQFHIRTLMILVAAAAALLAAAPLLPGLRSLRIYHFSLPIIIFTSMILVSYAIAIAVIVSVNRTRC